MLGLTTPRKNLVVCQSIIVAAVGTKMPMQQCMTLCNSYGYEEGEFQDSGLTTFFLLKFDLKAKFLF